jgi:hypothetical protein
VYQLSELSIRHVIGAGAGSVWSLASDIATSWDIRFCPSFSTMLNTSENKNFIFLTKPTCFKLSSVLQLGLFVGGHKSAE